jgi:hypothetical protein
MVAPAALAVASVETTSSSDWTTWERQHGGGPPRRRRVLADVGVQRIGTEEAQEESVADLDERHLSRDVERRLPTQTVDVETPGLFEVGHPEGDAMHAWVHT